MLSLLNMKSNDKATSWQYYKIGAIVFSVSALGLIFPQMAALLSIQDHSYDPQKVNLLEGYNKK